MTKPKGENLGDVTKRTCRVKQEYVIMETVAFINCHFATVSPNTDTKKGEIKNENET